MSTFEFKRASRQGVKPLIALYAESGCGKTYSGLLLARGIAGPNGRIGMIDSESGRGSLYADVVPGGYEVLELEAPFSPARYVQAIEALEKGGFDIGVIDSGSHEWEGIGGVLDMAGELESQGKKGLAVWKTPKMEHARMVLKLLQSRLPLIICLRAKYKSRQKGGTVIKDDYTSPIQAEDFIFEMMAHAEILPDHSIRLTKCSHPALRECFPADGKEPLSIKHGEAIARWANNPGASPEKKPVDQTATLKKDLWNETKSEHGGDKAAFSTFLRAAKLISDDEDPSTLSADRLNEVLSKVRDIKASAGEQKDENGDYTF